VKARPTIRPLALAALFATTAAAASAQTPLGELSTQSALASDPQLGRLALGAPGAPVVVVIFAPFACPDCASFAASELPKLNSAYLDAGAARLVVNDIAVSMADVAAALALRCKAPADPWPRLAALWESAKTWRSARIPADAIAASLAPTGLSGDDATACMTDEYLMRAVGDETARLRKLGLRDAPAFAVDGKLYAGLPTFKSLTPLIDAALARAR
jgi:protein-disulfide isomerase